MSGADYHGPGNVRPVPNGAYGSHDSHVSCPNGPDEHGDWPCDPDPHGDGTATCAACGWRGRWLPVCEHKVTERIGWQGGVPIYECRRCLAVIIYEGNEPIKGDARA